ncbi:unnamed protein product, partial [Medioppia subpectinata]
MSIASEEDFYDIENVDQFVDIISQLADRYQPPLDLIFNYLSAPDLCRMACVSQRWKRIVCTDSAANHRRTRYLKRLRRQRKSVGQENWPIKGRTPAATRSRTALSDIHNMYRTVKPTKKTLQSSLTNTTTISTPNTRQSQRLRDMGLRAM